MCVDCGLVPDHHIVDTRCEWAAFTDQNYDGESSSGKKHKNEDGSDDGSESEERNYYRSDSYLASGV